MKAVLFSVALCILHVSSARDDAGFDHVRNFQMRPLHKPETQTNPVIIPVPVYTPVQQHPVQQIPVQQYPYVPVQQYPMHYPHYQVHPQLQYYQYYPHNFHGIPC